MTQRLRLITVNDTMQKGYQYTLTAPMGKEFDARFLPELTPAEMLEAGVFGGKYMTDCQKEFPADRRTNAKLATHQKDPKLNFFGVDASLSLHEREQK